MINRIGKGTQQSNRRTSPNQFNLESRLGLKFPKFRFIHLWINFWFWIGIDWVVYIKTDLYPAKYYCDIVLKRDKLNKTYFSSSTVFVNVTSAPFNCAVKPSNSVGIVFDFCALRSVRISSVKNSTNSRSAKTIHCG